MISEFTLKNTGKGLYACYQERYFMVYALFINHLSECLTEPGQLDCNALITLVQFPVFIFAWASYQIRKIVGCACAGNAGNVFPATDFKGNRYLAIPACIMACMWGSLSCGGGENVPGIPGACGTRNFTYLVRGPYQEVNCNSVRPIANQMNIFHLEWEVHPSLLTDGLNPGGHKLSQWEMWLELIFFPSHCQNTVNTFQYDGLHDSTKVQHHPVMRQGNRQFCRPLTGVDGYEFCKFFLNGLKP